MSGIKSIYVDSSACVRVKWGEGEQFRIDSRVRQGSIMFSGLFSVYMDGAMKEVKIMMRRREVRFLEDAREWRFPGLLYADDLVPSGESKEDLRAILGRFAEVCRRRGLKCNADKSKVMVLNGEE